jgi:hypothetical protein
LITAKAPRVRVSQKYDPGTTHCTTAWIETYAAAGEVFPMAAGRS